MTRRTITTAEAPAPIGPYSQAVATESLIYTAGQVPVDPSTGLVVGDDIRDQTRQSLRNIDAILSAAGTSMKNVLKTTVFLRDLNDFPGMNEVYAEFFRDSPPARTTVEVSRLPRDVRVEIEAVAVKS